MTMFPKPNPIIQFLMTGETGVKWGDHLEAEIRDIPEHGGDMWTVEEHMSIMPVECDSGHMSTEHENTMLHMV